MAPLPWRMVWMKFERRGPLISIDQEIKMGGAILKYQKDPKLKLKFN